MKTFSKSPSETHMNKKNCALCGSSESRMLWKNSPLPFVKCSGCGLVFQNPQPIAAELTDRYDGEYFDYEIENEDGFYNLMKLGLQDVGFFNEESRILEESIIENRRPLFLDAGCATGRLIHAMRERGWDVKGVEVCPQSVDYARQKRNLDIYLGSLEAAAYSADSFDVVHCSHLIEHLTDPSAFITEAARILKPGGLFIAVTPDISGFQAGLFRAEWRSAIADHMYLFSKKTLKMMMEQKGFKLSNTVTWGGLAAGTAPIYIKKAADRLVKYFGTGDVVCIMGMK